MILVHCSRKEIGRRWAEILSSEFGAEMVSLSEQVQEYEKVEIAVCWKAPKRMFYDYPNLKFIQSVGAGVDHIFDSENAIPGAKIARIIDPQLSADMFEFILAIVLANMKQLNLYYDQQRRKLWKENSYNSIKDITISILGLGVIGSHVASNLSAIGFNTLGWSQSEKNISGVQSFQGIDGLNDMLAQTDYLVNILPLTESTRNIIDANFLSKLKKSSYFINVGRGPQVVDQALISAIDQGILSGATLDVFHHEPLHVDHEFWTHPKIIVTPHVASITNLDTASEQVFENIRRYKKGLNPINQVSLDKKY